MEAHTIAAISTPAGEGGLGVVRVSGPDACTVGDRVFRAKSGRSLNEIPGYTALFGQVFDGDELLDVAVALKFAAPKSYTGEDVVELSVHGGHRVLTRLLRAVLAAGATMAGPGAFTKRAFLNGKMDLTQAESVMSLIKARSDSQLRLSLSAYAGGMSRKVESLTALLTDAAAHLAVYSDYPEEELPELSEELFGAKLRQVKEALARLIDTYDTGRMINEGVSTAIVGKPNVGKSTLMNCLTGTDTSIVTDVAGTTRDVVEGTVLCGHALLRLADTAGIRDTADKVEQIGVARAKDRMEGADLVLAVLDTSRPVDEEDRALLASLGNKRTVVVLNKIDQRTADFCLPDCPFPTAEVSAATQEGLETLTAVIDRTVGLAGFDPAEAVLLGERQLAAARKAAEGVDSALCALENGFTLDAVGICVDDALYALCELTGKRVTNEVTDAVFRQFCVGK